MWAKEIADACGIDEAIANMIPVDKADEINELKSQGLTVTIIRY
jgi:cation transport ATPase